MAVPQDCNVGPAILVMTPTRELCKPDIRGCCQVWQAGLHHSSMCLWWRWQEGKRRERECKVTLLGFLSVYDKFSKGESRCFFPSGSVSPLEIPCCSMTSAKFWKPAECWPHLPSQANQRCGAKGRAAELKTSMERGQSTYRKSISKPSTSALRGTGQHVRETSFNIAVGC